MARLPGVSPLSLAALLAALLLAAPAQAHRVNIFAVAAGDIVTVECRFSRSSPAVDSAVTVFDARTGEELAGGRTDTTGTCVFPVSGRMREAAGGLRFHVNAGEGHQNDFLLPAGELAGGQGAETGAAAAEPAVAPPGASRSTDGGASRVPADSVVTMTRAELEALVARAVDQRLAPLKRALAAEGEKGPGMTEIMGGIGWILGIFGAAALVMARRRQ